MMQPAEPPAKTAPIQPNQNPPKRWPNPWIAVLLVIASFLVATVVAQLILSIYPALQHWSSARAESWINDNTIVQFIYTVLAYGLIILPILLFLRHRKISLAAIGLKRPRWRDPGWALLALPVYFISYGILVSVVSQVVPRLNIDQKQQIGFGGATGATDLILTFVSLAIVPPLIEELLMRGFLFSSLRARLKLPIAVVITSLVFASGHLQFGSGAPLLWIAAIDTFTLSLFLIYLRVKTDSIWASICLHALKNTIAFVTIFILHKG